MEVSGYNLSWHTFTTHLSEVSRELYRDKYFSDITLVSDDLRTVPAHRIVLSAASPVLKKLLMINPTVQTQLFLKGIKHQQLDSVLKFIYHGEVQVPSNEIDSFLRAGSDLEIPELSNMSGAPGYYRGNKPEAAVKDEPLTEVNVLNTDMEEHELNFGNDPCELPSWDGELLYPPHSTAPSKTWRLGGFRKVAGILQKSHTVCGACGKEIKYRSSPTNLQQHLASQHSQQWKALL